jgi:hypothetical protein
MRRTVRTLPLIAVLLCASGRVHAQEAAADALFDNARAAMEKGDFAHACQQFQASDKLDPAAGTEFNWADCEEQLGHLASAWELFRTVEEKLTETDERQPVAHARAKALQARVPRLTLNLTPTAPKDSTVRDGNVQLGAAAFGIALPVETGAHELVVSAPGFEPRTYQLRLSEAQNQELSVEPGAPIASQAFMAPLTSAAPSPREAPKSDGSGRRTLGFTLGGVGILGLGAGAAAAILTIGKKHAVEADCRPDKSCTSAGLDAAKSGRTLQMISNIGWIAGAVGVGAGAYFLLSSGASNQPSTSVALATDPSGGRVALSRSW